MRTVLKIKHFIEVVVKKLVKITPLVLMLYTTMMVSFIAGSSKAV